MFAATIFLTLVTRHYQKAIMKRRGLDGISDYTEFLKVTIIPRDNKYSFLCSLMYVCIHLYDSI